MISFVSNIKPLSYNSKRVAKYEERLKDYYNDIFSTYFCDLPYDKPLASKIVYIHKDKNNILDVDNLSKPFVDAFRGIIYTDDALIKHRVCSRIGVEESNNISINYSDMNENVAKKFDEYMLDDTVRDIVYFEVADFDYDMVNIGGKYETI